MRSFFVSEKLQQLFSCTDSQRLRRVSLNDKLINKLELNRLLEERQQIITPVNRSCSDKWSQHTAGRFCEVKHASKRPNRDESFRHCVGLLHEGKNLKFNMNKQNIRQDSRQLGVPESGGGSRRRWKHGNGLGALLPESLAFTRRHLMKKHASFPSAAVNPSLKYFFLFPFGS